MHPVHGSIIFTLNVFFYSHITFAFLTFEGVKTIVKKRGKACGENDKKQRQTKKEINLPKFLNKSTKMKNIISLPKYWFQKKFDLFTQERQYSQNQIVPISILAAKYG